MHKTTEIEQLRFAVEDVVENLKELKAFVLRGLGELRAEISALNFNGVLGANEFMRQAASIQRQIDSYGGTLSRIENVAEATIKLFEALDAALGTTPPSKIQG
jgi:predicted methyltransferase